VANSAVQQSGAMQRSALAAASGAGFDNTITSSPMGAPTPTTAQKTLLGS
jgi:hypothetical protein